MSHRLEELIDIPRLQRLMDLLHAATSLPVGIIDLEGNILVATGWKDICTRFHRLHPLTAARCRESDDYIKSRLHNGDYVQYKCRNGLWDVACPIVIAGEHLATLFLGQFFYDDETIDREFFHALGTECGFNLDEYLSALSDVPVLSRKMVADIMAYYSDFVGFLSDMGLTRLRQMEAEQTLRRSEMRFRTFFENSSDMLAIVNPDGTVRFVSPAIIQLLGHHPHETEGRNLLDLVHPDDIPSAAATFSSLLSEAGGTRKIINRLKAGDGTWRVCETVARNLLADPAIQGLLFNVRDVTERHRVETVLMKSQEMFSRIFNTAPIPITISTLAEGRYIEVNRAFSRMTGYRREEVVGQAASSLTIWLVPEERSRLLALLREKGEVQGFEFVSRGKGGMLHTGLLSACIIQLDGEDCVIMLNYDITERKRAEDEIEELNRNLVMRAAELEAANRELEAFGYSLSHDLKNPLTRISISAQELRSEYAGHLDANGKIFIDSIYEASEKMEGLIDAMLKLSRLARKDLSRTEIDLGELARSIALEMQLAEPERRVEFVVGQDISVVGDQVLLKAALENLIGNAWKYTGKIADARIELGTVTRDGERIFFVRDNGAGFSMEDVGRIFHPFQRLHRGNEFNGSGIGLATVQRIIHRHGGRIWAEGALGKGATFYFTLP